MEFSKCFYYENTFTHDVGTRLIILNPPLNEKIPESWKRGFNIYQISRNLGVQFSLLFDRFGAISSCKTAKKPQKFSRASRAFLAQGFNIFQISPNVLLGVLIFSKSHQMFPVGVLSRGGLILSPRYM